MYIMVIPVFFVLGMVGAAWMGVAEGQGLAGGAIVLFYGFIGAFVGLILMVIVALKVKQLSVIKKINILMLILFLIAAGWVAYRVVTNLPDENEVHKSTPVPTEATSPADSSGN